MNEVRLSAAPKGDGYQATVTFSNGVSISSAESFPSIAEAITVAAPERIEAMEREDDDDPPSQLPSS